MQLAKKRKISRGKGKQAMLTEEMVYEMNRSASQSYGLDNPYQYGLDKDMESWKSDKYRYKVSTHCNCSKHWYMVGRIDDKYVQGEHTL